MPVGATTSINTWGSQQTYIERLMDNASFTMAHPQDTLILAGPARFANVKNADTDLLPIGHVMSMNLGQQRPVQPLSGIGSARTFFAAGKGLVTFQMARLMVNGRNLLRAMYTQAIQQGVPVEGLAEPPVSANGKRTEQFWANLDSTIFYVPIGICVLFRSVAHDMVGGFYLELCMFNSWNTGFQAGQPIIQEQVQGMADRIRPVYPSDFDGNIMNQISSPELSKKMLNLDMSELSVAGQDQLAR